MKAAQIKTYGEAEIIEVTEVQIPSPSRGQVLVEVHAAAINPFDWKIRKGYMKEQIPLSFPLTIGGDFSGVITELGEDVSEFAIGDEVFGTAITLSGGSGAIAEFAVANIGNIAKKPKSIDHQGAAALVLVGASAIQALEEHINLQPGQRILIHGGAGGIGSVAIQIAKSKGAYVAATASTESKEFVKSLGADEVIDYKNESFETILHDLDAVYDTVGGETTDKSFAVIKKGGVIVSMVGQPNPELAEKYGVTAIGQGTQTHTQHLIRVAELVDSGVIKPQIDTVFPLDQTKEAFQHLETGHPHGKVVVNTVK